MTLDWEKYIAIADRFQRKAKAEDREDLRQDIIVRLAEVARNNGHKPLTVPAMIRVASYTAMAYWRDLKRKPTILSLNHEIEDGEGNTIELWQTLADDKAIDVEAWIDARVWLMGCPKRLIRIANKIRLDKPLDNKDHQYLWRFRRKAQKGLFDRKILPPQIAYISGSTV